VLGDGLLTDRTTAVHHVVKSSLLDAPQHPRSRDASQQLPANMNTPYFRGSNEENAMATSPLAPPHTVNATPNRRVLGDVSTNPRVFSSPATGGLFSKKVMMGSPLKRSFTAAVEEGYGLKYLKKRRMSGEMGFGPVENRASNRVRRDDAGAMSRARSVPEPATVRTCALQWRSGTDG
jgi:hypothetical protein